MDPKMQQSVLPSHHWSKVARRIILVIAFVLIAFRGFHVGLPWVKAKIESALGDKPKEPAEPIVVVTGDGNFTMSGNGNTVAEAPRVVDLLVKKQSCVAIMQASMANDSIAVRVRNYCRTPRNHVKLTVKARDVLGVVVGANYKYIVSGDSMDVGEIKDFGMNFTVPSKAINVELSVDPGNTQ